MQKYPQIAQRWLACALLASFPASMGVCAESVPQSVEFNRDIRPIFSDRCFACHGPDEGKRMSKLRLDTEAGAKSRLGDHFAIVPGKAADSELIRRVTSDDLARRMPPAYSGAAKLTEREIGLLTRWIAQGATWQKHWSLLTPARPDPPKVADRGWARRWYRGWSADRRSRRA